jgi:hypothetical protein
MLNQQSLCTWHPKPFPSDATDLTEGVTAAAVRQDVPTVPAKKRLISQMGLEEGDDLEHRLVATNHQEQGRIAKKPMSQGYTGMWTFVDFVDFVALWTYVE